MVRKNKQGIDFNDPKIQRLLAACDTIRFEKGCRRMGRFVRAIMDGQAGRRCQPHRVYVKNVAFALEVEAMFRRKGVADPFESACRFVASWLDIVWRAEQNAA